CVDDFSIHGLLILRLGFGAVLLGLLLGGDLFRQFLRGFHQGIGFGFDFGLVVALAGFFRFLDGRFDLVLLVRFQLVAMLAQRFLYAVDEAVCLIAGIDGFTQFAVFVRILGGFLFHALDFFFAQTGVGLDRDLVFLASGLVLGRNVQDAVGIDVESDLDLRHAARCRRDVGQIELAQALVAGSHFAFALQHVNGHGGLVVISVGEYL